MAALYDRIILFFSLPIYALIIPIEILLSNYRHKNFYSIKETIVNIYMNLLNAGVDFLMRMLLVMALLHALYQYHLPIVWNPFLYWFFLLLSEDFLFWLEHFYDHRIRLFWAVHVTHHSSPEYNLTTGFRSSVFMPVYKYLYFVPLVFLGFQPIDIVFMYSITQIYGILVHTQFQIKMPTWVEYVFVTPSHHRVHHASNIRYLDRNMGMVFIIWDRMFGTFTAEQPDDLPVYGITKPVLQPYHPVHIVTHEWQALVQDLKKPVNWSAKLKYLFYPPGWSHDGSSLTTKQIQKAATQEHNSN